MARQASIDVSHFSEKARKDLLQILESVPGKKNLVLERALVGPIELLVNFPTLQERGVDRVFFLENDNANSSQRNVIFIARGDKPKQAQSIATQIKSLQQSSGPVDHEFSVFWVPRRTLLCDTILEESGVLGEVTSGEFPLYFQCLEPDLLSLELSRAFGDLYLHKDPTCIYTSAKALMQLQQRHGLFPKIIGKGDNAQDLARLLLRLRSESLADGDSGAVGLPTVATMPSNILEHLIIIDRGVDLATPLLTQLTYEGLIDETYEIDHNQIELDASLIGQAPQASSTNTQEIPSQKRKVKLDSKDKLYAQLRDANFGIVGGLLNKVARRLQSDYETRHGSKTTSELREFVSKLPGYQAEQQSLKIHTSLVEEVMKRTRSETFTRALEIQQNVIAGTDPTTFHETLEDLIARDAPLSIVLRLLCLESCVSGGLRQKDYEFFKRLILQAHGYKHLLTLDALEKMQLLRPRTASIANTLTLRASTSDPTDLPTNYSAVRKALHLIVDDISEDAPSDIAYAYSGYAPLSVRLVQCVLQKSYLATLSAPRAGTGAPPSQAGAFAPFSDMLARNVRGSSVDTVQRSADRASKARQTLEGRGAGIKTSVVFFLGGITFAEIAALRFISGQEESEGRRRVLICTTGVISGGKMMRAAMGEVD